MCHFKTTPNNMRQTIIISFLTFLSLTVFGQTEDSLYNSRMSEMMKEMEMMKHNLKPQTTDNFVAYFKPELIDSFFVYINKDDFNKLYDNTDDLLKRIQSKNDLEKYFKAVKQYYGQIKTYEKETYTIKNQMMSMNKVASATYKVKFDKTNATVTLAFNVIDSMTIRLQTFQISPENYNKIDEFDKISKSTFDYLISTDYPGLYNSTSKRFQTYTPIGKYEEFTKQLKDIDFKNYKQHSNQIGVVDGKLMLYVIYDINEKRGYLTLTFTETDNTYLLEGLNYEPSE
jgi:hypothetical protein